MSRSSIDFPMTVIRPGENPLKRWFLITGGRLGVMVLLMAAVFFILLFVSLIRPIGMRDLLTETNAAKTLFSSLLSGAILLVTIVVSINSIVLSQEMTDLEDQQRRIEASVEFHNTIEGYIDEDIAPARPADFLIAVLYALSRQVDALEQHAEESDNSQFRDDVSAYCGQVTDEIRLARDRLDGADHGTVNVLVAGLNYNYSGQLHAIRGLKRCHEATISEPTVEQLEDTIETLKHLGAGREYFKSLYYKRELARLSGRLLYVSLPVIVFSSYVILALDANLVPDISIFGVSPLLVSVSLGYSIAIAPYILLTTYIVRATTITLRTLTAGPFLFQEGSELESHIWENSDQSRDWPLTGDD